MNKKLTPIVALCIAALLFLSGCETMSELQKASSKGIGAVSCDQINNTFRAYQNDRQSLTAYKQIADLTNLNLEGVNTSNVASYYNNVRDAANVALLVQGCQPLSSQ